MKDLSMKQLASLWQVSDKTIRNWISSGYVNIKKTRGLISGKSINDVAGTSSRLMTKHDIANRYGVSERTVDNWRSANSLQFVMIGSMVRFTAENIIKFEKDNPDKVLSLTEKKLRSKGSESKRITTHDIVSGDNESNDERSED